MHLKSPKIYSEVKLIVSEVVFTNMQFNIKKHLFFLDLIHGTFYLIIRQLIFLSTKIYLKKR